MTPQLPAFLFLALSLCAAWLPPLKLAGRPLPAWLLLLVMAMAWGLVGGVLAPSAVFVLLGFCYIAWRTAAAPAGWRRCVLLAATIVLALLLAMHKLPGFHNPLLNDGVRYTPDAAPFTQYLNFDKGAVGLVLLALLCKRVTTWRELGGVVKRTWPIMLLTIAATLGFALAAGFVRPALKLPAGTAAFLAVNLLFTVIAEEAFFRGLVQARLAPALSGQRYGAAVAVACSALLFGAAHLGGGLRYGILASIAGLGYALAYQSTQRIEAPVLVHFALNAVHFIAFTYPYLA